MRSLAYQFAGNLKIVDMNANAELKGVTWQSTYTYLHIVEVYIEGYIAYIWENKSIASVWQVIGQR